MGEDVISSHMEGEVKLESDDSGMSGPLGTKLESVNLNRNIFICPQ